MKQALRSILAVTTLGLCPASAGLDGATGHIFKFDPEAKTFELLKETEYDPKTESATSRFTVHWTDKTEVMKSSQKASFAGLEESHMVTFQGIDARNSKALAEGKQIVVGMATVYLGGEIPPVATGGQRGITGRFTPHPGKAPTGGILDMDGKSVNVSLRPKTGTITVHEKASVADLAQGFWQTTIRGEESGGRFVASFMQISPLPDPLATDDPALPRVLIIGDSISMNYFESAKKELKGVVNLHRNEGNAGPSTRGVSNTELWLGNYKEKGRHWDVIQFNHGLHDLKQVYDAKTDTFGAYSVSMTDYKTNLEKQISILNKTGAKLIWCATTPVPNDNKSQYARRKGACTDFNKTAMEVMAKHPEIRINDLHATVTKSPVFDNWRKTIDVHFYKKEECEALGKAVADAVRAALNN
jgi:acyl-CoA thioesterase-1